jgi:hypothetical protein
MKVSRKAKESNIAEYVLYMFQIEDLIRAHHLKIKSIEERIIFPMFSDEQTRAEYSNWYKGIIEDMKSAGAAEKGHTLELQELLLELLMLHNTLVNIVRNEKYIQKFNAALPVLNEFQAKTNTPELNLIELGFNALYAKLILKLQKKEISEASETGFTLISRLLGGLAAHYKKMKMGDLNFTNN